jgi:primosomal protein N' (replication factor Y) (superfamily II helicase)
VSAAIAQVEPLTTARALRGPFDYLLPEEIRSGVGVGTMLVVPFGRREVLGVVVGLAETSEIARGRLLAPLRALQNGVPAELVGLAEWIALEYCSTVARALRLVLPPGPVRPPSPRSRKVVVRRPVHLPVGARLAHPPELAEDQRRALEELEEELRRREFSERLLHGVTGSGKTEIYLRAVSATLEQGRGAIVMVPEIALTPQMVGRFLERFGETVAVLHSRLGLPERREEWRRLRAGEARVCIGPRSAVFAPIEGIGMIAVDEEHESSYKHEGDPRYDARTVARWRALKNGALLLLGSATPRAESAKRTPRLRLPRRVDGRALPAVEILDMRGQSAGLHQRSADGLAELRRRHGKAIVLLNRRGWSSFLSCRSCGVVWSCHECDVALVVHRAWRRIACHHCGHSEPIPQRCRCGSVSLARHGTGTERVEHELTAALADGGFPIFRLDADTVGAGDLLTHRERQDAEGGAGAVLRRFESAPAGVLIGTQMVAKGHDFPDVSLGLVLDADATLRFPDFRAEERTFALIAQLAGRVGRGTEGRVLVQTIAPQARAIVHAAAHDSDGFLAGELERRQELRYPPFSELIRVICSSPDPRAADRAATALGEHLHGLLSRSRASVLGPASLFRLRGRERRALVIKASRRARAARAVDAAVQRAASSRAHLEVSFSVDVDPQ